MCAKDTKLKVCTSQGTKKKKKKERNILMVKKIKSAWSEIKHYDYTLLAKQKAHLKQFSFYI